MASQPCDRLNAEAGGCGCSIPSCALLNLVLKGIKLIKSQVLKEGFADLA